MRRALLPVLIVAACGACSDEASDTPVADTGTVDAAADAVGTDVGADSGDDTSVMDAGVFPDVPMPSTHVLIVDEIRGARELDTFVSYGFDLDGRVSDGEDGASCNHQDFTSPEGDEGIDNQFALLLPIIEGAGGQALEALIQNAINDGNVLVVLEFEGLDDIVNDDDVSMNILRGVGRPVLGFDARMAPDQTFDIDPDGQFERAEGLSVHDGVIRATGLEFTLPVYVFEYLFPMDLTNGVVEVQFHEDGTAVGRLAGGVQVANVEYLAEVSAIPSSFRNLLVQIASSYADMEPDEDGVCQAFSVTFEFNATTGFLYGDAQRPPAPE